MSEKRHSRSIETGVPVTMQGELSWTFHPCFRRLGALLPSPNSLVSLRSKPKAPRFTLSSEPCPNFGVEPIFGGHVSELGQENDLLRRGHDQRVRIPAQRRGMAQIKQGLAATALMSSSSRPR